MTDQLRPTRLTVSLKDNQIEPAMFGRKVIALNKGGVLCFTTVDKHFDEQFDAWCEFPTVPESVKLRQSRAGQQA